jgi:hypothetical protein
LANLSKIARGNAVDRFIQPLVTQSEISSVFNFERTLVDRLAASGSAKAIQYFIKFAKLVVMSAGLQLSDDLFIAQGPPPQADDLLNQAGEKMRLTGSNPSNRTFLEGK